MSRARELTLVGALLCLTAALFGVPALYMPGIAALLGSALAAVWVRASTARAGLALRCEDLTVQEGESVQMSVRVRRGRTPFPGAVLTPWPGARAIPVRGSEEIRGRTALSRRGRHTVGPAVLSVADPLGLCAADIRSDTAEVLVLPRVHRVDERDLALIGGTGRSSRETPQEIDSLRAHRPGGPASRIHWPTVARSGVLMEHSLRPEDDPRVLVEVDAMRPESGRALDQALSAAASLCVHLARHGGCLLLLPDDARAAVIRADLRGWPGLHARLALVQAGTGAPRIRRNVRALTVIHVTAASGPEPAIGGPHYRVAPSPLPELGVAFKLAGCCCQQVHGRHLARSA